MKRIIKTQEELNKTDKVFYSEKHWTSNNALFLQDMLEFSGKELTEPKNKFGNIRQFNWTWLDWMYREVLEPKDLIQGEVYVGVDLDCKKEHIFQFDRFEDSHIYDRCCYDKEYDLFLCDDPTYLYDLDLDNIELRKATAEQILLLHSIPSKDNTEELSKEEPNIQESNKEDTYILSLLIRSKDKESIGKMLKELAMDYDQDRKSLSVNYTNDDYVSYTLSKEQQ